MIRALLTGAILLVVQATPAVAAEEGRPLRIIIPSGPGSATDVRGRWLADRLAAALSRTVIPDNRAGAGGVVGTQLGARATPDGNTLLIVHQGTMAIIPHMMRKPGYDPVADFAPITRLGVSALLLSVHPGQPLRTVGDLVQLAKKRPDALDYGSPGGGTPPHMATALLASMTGINVVHVPYKGGGDALVALMGGRHAFGIDGVAVQLPQVQAGRIRPLAVTTSTRVSALPNVPTMAEAGVPGYEYAAWIGISAPAATPRKIVLQLNAEIRRIMSTAEARQWFSDRGAEPVTDTPEEFAEFIKGESAKLGPLVKSAGLRMD